MKNITQIFIFAFALLFASISFAQVQSATGFENGSSERFQDGTGSGTRSIQSSVKKTGTYALRVNPTTSGSGALAIGCPSAVGDVTAFCSVADAYIEFFFRVDTLPASGYVIFAKPLNAGAGAMLHIRLNSDGTIAVADAGNTLKTTGTTVLSTATWYRLGINTKPGGAAAYSLKINGTTEVSGTANQGGSNFGLMQLGKLGDTATNTVDFYYDDYVLNNTGFLGNLIIKTALVDGNGSRQTYGFSSGTNSSNYLEVDEIPSDADTTYVASAGAGVANFTVQDASTAGISGNIKAVVVYAERKEPSAVTSSAVIGLDSNSVRTATTAEDMSTAYLTRQLILNTDPNTSTAWTESGFNAIEIYHKQDNAVGSRVTNINAQVVYEEVLATPTPTATATATITVTPTATATPITLKCQMLTGVGQ